MLGVECRDRFGLGRSWCRPPEEVRGVNGTKMSGQEKSVRVSFTVSREAAIKLREITLSQSELLRGLNVLAVQLGNESQICISSPLNFNFAGGCGTALKDKHSEEDFDSELTDSISEASESEKMSEEESTLNVDRGVREVDQEVALATAASVKLCDDPEPSVTVTNKGLLKEKTSFTEMNARNALYQEIHSKKSQDAGVVKEECGDFSSAKVTQELTARNNSPYVNNESNKFDKHSGVSFAQHLINLSKQYRSENAKSPTIISNDKFYTNDSSRIVGNDHILRCFNDKAEDFMGLNVNNSLFDSYGTSVKSAEELSKEQSEMSPTNLDSMSVSSADSLFEEARLGSVDELRLSPSSVAVPTHASTPSDSPSPPETLQFESYPPTKSTKSKRSMKFQKLLKGQTGIVCELCMQPVQKSYSCYQLSYAPKEIVHLFEDGSSCVRVCRRCLPYKAPKGNDKNGHKKGRKTSEQLQR